MKVLLRNSTISRVKLPQSSSNFFSNTVNVRDENGWWETANPNLDFCIFNTDEPKENSPLFSLLSDEYTWGNYKQSVDFVKNEINKVELGVLSGKQYLKDILTCYLSGADRETGKIYDVYITE